MTEATRKAFETNNAISKFMGWHIEIVTRAIGGNYNILEWVDEKGENVYCGDNDFSLTDEANCDYSIQFDSDFNWLILAVERIESLGYKVKICRKRCQICRDQKEEVFFIDVKTDSKHKSVYEAILQFIKTK